MQVIKLMLVLLLSLSLSAQAFAGTILPCQMNMQSADHDHGVMQHSALDHNPGMDHSQMSASKMQTMDCCLQECKCPKAACASLALLNTATNSLEKPSSPRLLPLAVELTMAQLKELIRPPILS